MECRYHAMKTRHSIFSKLFVSLLAVTVVPLMIASFYLTSSLESHFIQILDQELAVQARLVADALTPWTRASDPRQLQQLIERFAALTRKRISVISPGGEILADSDPAVVKEMARPTAEVLQTISSGVGRRTSEGDALATSRRYVAVPVKNTGGEVVAVVRVALVLEDLGQLERDIKLRVFGTFIAASLLVVLSTVVLSRMITEPLRRLLAGVHSIAAGNYGHQVRIVSRDEFGELGEVLNSMSRQLQANIEAVNEEKAKSEAILRNMADGVVAVEHTGSIFLFNEAAEKIFGRSAESAIGKTILEVVRNHEFSALFEDVPATGMKTEEIVIYAPRRRHLRVTVFRLVEGTGPSIGAAAVVQDITEIKRLEQLRTEFVANVSHELRTPLTSIKGFIETLLEGAYSDQETCTRFLRIIEKESSRLENLINDLLDLSRIESGRVQPSNELVELPGLVESVLLSFETQAKNKEIKMAADFPNGFAPIKADKEMLRQVLINLIDNAIKYTPEGGSVTIRGHDLGDAVRVEVIDTGIGIPQEHLPRLFERFYRVDKARSRSLGGTGLGLSIVKHIVESHGGTVGVESELGQGTTVHFLLPKR